MRVEVRVEGDERRRLDGGVVGWATLWLTGRNGREGSEDDEQLKWRRKRRKRREGRKRNDSEEVRREPAVR
jgi:hypothetical protein